MMITCLTHPCLHGYMRFGVHTVSIDLLAQKMLNCMERFNMNFLAPGSEAVDAFTCNWSTHNNWLFPPVNLIPMVIGHTQASGAKGILIVPQWLSSPLWPILFPNGTEPADFILECLELPCGDGLILPGSSGASLFHGLSNTPVLAIQFQCDIE